MMLRALWIWQRWIAAAEPKVRRIAFDNAFERSTMNSLGTLLREQLSLVLDGCQSVDQRCLGRLLAQGFQMATVVFHHRLPDH
jgi:hypothetical protein